MASSKITTARIEAARLLDDAIKKERVLDPARLSSDYCDPDNLQRWMNKKFTTYRSLCSDPEAFNTWISEGTDPESIISKFISLAAMASKPQYTVSQFPIYKEPKETITALLDDCKSELQHAKQFLADALLDEENNRIESGEPIEAVQADYTETVTEAAATSSTAGSSATATKRVINPVYATGPKQSADYMDQLTALGYTFRLNNVSNRIEVNGKEIDDPKLSEIRLAMYDTGFKGKSLIEDCITVSAKQNEYHPVKEYFRTLNWDGEERLKLFTSLLHPTNPVLAGVLFQKWMIGAVAKVEEQAQNPMLVLEGDQGIGKSSLARWLCPIDPDTYHKEGSIKPDEKSSQIAACERLIWEVGELGKTIRGADHEALKDFLTTRNFTILEPYAHFLTTRSAMASFIGTINDQGGFLKDPTGNRRFWIIEIQSIDYSYNFLYNKHDLWAEAYARYKRGESNTLTDEEYQAVLEIQENYKAPNMTAEVMMKCFDIDPQRIDWIMPITDIRETLKLQGGLSEMDVTPYKLGAAAKELGLPKAFQKKINGDNRKCYKGIRTKVQG